MTPKDFRASLKSLRWSQAELARRLGLAESTVCRWKLEREVPQYAAAYLELALKMKQLQSLVQP